MNVERLVGQDERWNVFGSLRSSGLAHSTPRGDAQRLLHDMATQPARPRDRQSQPVLDPDLFQSFAGRQNRPALADPCRSGRQLGGFGRRGGETRRFRQRLDDIVDLAQGLQPSRDSTPAARGIHNGVKGDVQAEAQHHFRFASRFDAQLLGDACFAQHLGHEHVVVGLLPPIGNRRTTLAAREETLERVLPLGEIAPRINVFLDEGTRRCPAQIENVDQFPERPLEPAVLPLRLRESCNRRPADSRRGARRVLDRFRLDKRPRCHPPKRPWCDPAERPRCRRTTLDGVEDASAVYLRHGYSP